MNQDNNSTKKEWVSPELIELEVKETMSPTKNQPITNENPFTPSASLS